MKYLCLLLALLSVVRPAAAQAPHPTARPDSLPAALNATSAAPDTVAALHRLFVAKRKRNGYILGATFLVTVGVLVALVSNRPDKRASNNGFGVIAPNDLNLVLDAMVTLPLIPIIAVASGGWSPERERRAVAAWQQHQLARWTRRSLKPRYFQPQP